MNLFKKNPFLLKNTLFLSLAFSSFSLTGFSNEPVIDSDNEYDSAVAFVDSDDLYDNSIASLDDDFESDSSVAVLDEDYDYDNDIADLADDFDYDSALSDASDSPNDFVVTQPNTPKKKQTNSSLLEVKFGYFFFANQNMRKIYDKGGFDVQVSGSFPVWKWLDIYSSIEFLQKSGNSLNNNQKTSIWILPLSLGLKPVFRLCPEVEYYFAIGPRYIFLRQHNQSSYVSKYVNNNGFAGFVNTGFNFFLTPHFVLDIFGEYSYAKLHTKSTSTTYGQDTQLGGFTFGGGLGYAF